MRKINIILVFTGLFIFLTGCLPATSPGTGAVTAVPTQHFDRATAVPQETLSAPPTNTAAPTVIPLPTIALEEEPMPNNPGNVVPSSPDAHPEAVNLAVQDLAQRLTIDESEIEVISVEMVIWPDTSLGCPHPDMVYTQVQRDGLRILLQAENQIYAYHSGGVKPPFLCENPAKPGKPLPGSDEMAPPPGFNE
ncbi:MAG: hypothetical protein IAF02_10690 [Anaerolineae bacterium]|nr:hypothetical protein [Anaerolineae bacterium]